MESDYFTKALHGKAFHAHRKTSMNLMESTSLCFTRGIKIRTGEIISISPPIYNK